MPVLVGAQRLHEALALGGGLGSLSVEPAGLLEDAVDAGGAAGGNVGVEPVVAGDPGVVLVDLAVAVLPRVPLGGGQAEPQEEAGNRDAGLVGPAVDEVNDLIAGIVGNPESF